MKWTLLELNEHVILTREMIFADTCNKNYVNMFKDV